MIQEDLIIFIYNLLGTTYVWWKDDNEISTLGPFWAENSKVPDIDTIKRYGCNSAGFINLICRFLNLQIPGLSMRLPYAGGISVWFDYLNTFGLLEGFKPERNYPAGTLLLRNYSNSIDEGHIAIVLDVMRLVHSYSPSGIYIDESYYISHNWLPEGYYTHVCLPQKWIQNKLFKNE